MPTSHRMSEAPLYARYAIISHVVHLVNRDYLAMTRDYYTLQVGQETLHMPCLHVLCLPCVYVCICTCWSWCGVLMY